MNREPSTDLQAGLEAIERVRRRIDGTLNAHAAQRDLADAEATMRALEASADLAHGLWLTDEDEVG
jgi:hypothetical protein